MLAAGSEVGYIREPFSVLHRPGVLDVRFPYWFPYVCTENEGPYVRPCGTCSRSATAWARGCGPPDPHRCREVRKRRRPVRPVPAGGTAGRC